MKSVHLVMARNIALIILLWLTATVARPQTEAIGKVNGALSLQVWQYDSSSVSSVYRFRKSGSNTYELRTPTAIWSAEIRPGKRTIPGTVPFTICFHLGTGSMTNAGVAVVLDFAEWTTENNLMVPASVYDGNRFRAIGNGYMPVYPADMYYNPKVPLTISNNPRLNLEPGKSSRIELLTGNVSTPAMGFYAPGLKKSFLLLTGQGTEYGNNGLIIRENGNKDSLSMAVTAPGVRVMRCGFGDFFPSGDRGADFRAGDSIVLDFRMAVDRAEDVTGLFNRFFELRKSVTPEKPLRNIAPQSEIFRLAADICRNNWVTVPAGSFYRPENSDNFQLGWVSGLMNTFPMLFLDQDTERERVAQEFDFVIDKMQGASGYFYGTIRADGQLQSEKNNPEVKTVNAMVRKNSDMLFWSLKQFMLLKKQGHADVIKPAWERSVRRLAEAFCRTWETNGELGQYIDPETGKIVVFNSTAGSGVPAGLALAAGYFDEPRFLKDAREIFEFYYRRNLTGLGFFGGHCGDISQDADSESAFAFLESALALYRADGDRQWIDRATGIAALCSTWVLSYPYVFPPESDIARLGCNMTGAVFASIQNKHAAPGICTASGDYLFKLYRATGDERYANLINDIIHAHTEAVDLPGHRTTHDGFGTSMERIQTSDAEGKGATGNFIKTRNSWTETNGMLMALEIPGIYLLTDRDRMFVFDAVEVGTVNRDKNTILLEVTNPTPFDARVSLLAESSQQAGNPLSYNAFTDWPRIDIPAGKTIRIAIDRKTGKPVPTH